VISGGATNPVSLTCFLGEGFALLAEGDEVAELLEASSPFQATLSAMAITATTIAANNVPASPRMMKYTRKLWERLSSTAPSRGGCEATPNGVPGLEAIPAATGPDIPIAPIPPSAPAGRLAIPGGRLCIPAEATGGTLATDGGPDEGDTGSESGFRLEVGIEKKAVADFFFWRL
jgi:hypothetical protein